MPQIILIESDESLRAILKLNMMKCYGCEVIEKKTAIEALSLMDLVPDIDLIICREQMGFERTRLRITSYFEKEKMAIPVLVIGKKITENSWNEIINEAGKLLGLQPLLDITKIKDEYLPVGINYFYNITSVNFGCDFYIRVKKGDEYQFIKRLRSTDRFSREEIEKYKESGLREFFISKDEFKKFVDSVTAELVTKLNDPTLMAEERLRLNAEAFQVTIDRIHSLGIDSNTVELVDESIKSMESILKEENALATFLKSMKENKLSYGYAHSYLTCLVLHKVVAQFDWESAQVKEKLTFVSFFHDISLKQNEFMSLYSEEDLSNSSLSSEEKKIVLNHAYQSSVIVEQFKKIPLGIGTILKEHHGSKTGVGFPEVLSISIAPISMMFIVVEHFVDEFLKIEKNPTTHDFEKIFSLLGKRYNKITYDQTLIALKKMTLGKKSR